MLIRRDWARWTSLSRTCSEHLQYELVALDQNILLLVRSTCSEMKTQTRRFWVVLGKT